MASEYNTKQADTAADTHVSQQDSSNPPEAGDTAQGIGAQILDKAEEMGSHIRDTAQAIGAQLRDTAGEMGTQAQALGTQAKEAVSEYYEQGRQSLQALPQTLEAQIRARPFQALLVAGGVGLLLGLLWRRS